MFKVPLVQLDPLVLGEIEETLDPPVPLVGLEQLVLMARMVSSQSNIYDTITLYDLLLERHL